MAMRLIECHRVLKDTGSLYLHCDPTMSHYLKLLLDCIFREKNFRNEIVWGYQRWTGATQHFQRMHDTILFYSASPINIFNMLKEAYSNKSKHKAARVTKITDVGLEQDYTSDTSRMKAMRDVWDISYLNSQAKERVGYPTQKPLALLERIIKASTNEGDVVLDPFCGCATACVAAEKLGRQWIGIDISEKAQELVLVRLKNEVVQTNLKDWGKKVINTGGFPVRTDLEYETLPPVEVKTSLYKEQAGVCKGCEQHFRKENLEIDHIMPQVKGGSDHVSNLQLLCGYCNRVKGDRPMEYLLKVLNETLQETKYCSY